MKKNIKTTCSEHPVDCATTIGCDQNFQHPPHKIFIVGSGMEKEMIHDAIKATMIDDSQIYDPNKPNFIQIEKTEEGITARLLSEEEVELLTMGSSMCEPRFPTMENVEALAKAGRNAGRSMKELSESLMNLKKPTIPEPRSKYFNKSNRNFKSN